MKNDLKLIRYPIAGMLIMLVIYTPFKSLALYFAVIYLFYIGLLLVSYGTYDVLLTSMLEHLIWVFIVPTVLIQVVSIFRMHILLGLMLSVVIIVALCSCKNQRN